jgi:hypothetical protein
VSVGNRLARAVVTVDGSSIGQVAAARCQPDDVLAAPERVGGTGHRLDRQGGSVQFRLGPVGGVDLHPGKVTSTPLEDHAAAIRYTEHRLHQPVRPGRQVCEGVVDLGPTQLPTGAEVGGVSWTSRTPMGCQFTGWRSPWSSEPVTTASATVVSC